MRTQLFKEQIRTNQFSPGVDRYMRTTQFKKWVNKQQMNSYRIKTILKCNIR